MLGGTKLLDLWHKSPLRQTMCRHERFISWAKSFLMYVSPNVPKDLSIKQLHRYAWIGLLLSWKSIIHYSLSCLCFSLGLPFSHGSVFCVNPPQRRFRAPDIDVSIVSCRALGRGLVWKTYRCVANYRLLTVTSQRESASVGEGKGDNWRCYAFANLFKLKVPIRDYPPTYVEVCIIWVGHQNVFELSGKQYRQDKSCRFSQSLPKQPTRANQARNMEQSVPRSCTTWQLINGCLSWQSWPDSGSLCVKLVGETYSPRAASYSQFPKHQKHFAIVPVQELN